MKPSIDKSLLAASAAGLLALAPVLPAQADYSNTVMSLQPVGYWRLNERAGPPIDYGTGTATNSGYLGAAANAKYYHTPSVGQPGVLSNDSCVTLDGTSQYIDVPYNSVLNTNGPFSVEFWANQTAVAAGAKSGVMSYNGSTGFLFYTDNNAARWGFRVFYGTGRVYLVDNSGPLNVANTWYHVVGVYDGAYVHLYVNGVENTPPMLMPTNYVPVVAGTPLRIGGSNPVGNPSSYFNGSLDEVAVYPYALSSNQVAAHFDAATTNVAGYAAQILTDTPAGYWRLDEPGPLPPPPTSVPVTVTNRGSWGAGANGVLNALPTFNTGYPGLPYRGFGSNSACKFAGNGTYIQVPPQNLVTDSFTITCWTILTNTQQSAWSQFFASPTDTGLPTGFGFGNGNSPGMIYNSLNVFWTGALRSMGTYGQGITPSLFEPLNRWSFMAMVASPSNIVVYANGQMATNASGTSVWGPHDFSVTNLFLGYGIMGSLAEVAVFDQALTDAQVRELYLAAEVPPIIVVQPQAPPPPVYEGAALLLSVGVDNLSPTSYQWTKNGFPLPGQTLTNLTIGTLGTNDTGNYAVVVTNAFGAVTSSVVAVTVLASPPLIARPPQSLQRYAGGIATFGVTAIGSLPFSYQWSFNGTPISGANSSTWTVTDVRAGDAGTYSVLVSNPYGSTNVSAALTLLTPTNALATVVTERTPLAYWRLDETNGTVAYDNESGLNGTYGAGVTNNLPGPRPPDFQGFDTQNNAYAFNGSGGYVTLPSLGQFAGAMTIVAWIKPNAVQSDYAGLVFTRGGGGSTSGLGYTQGGQLGYTWNDAAATYNWGSLLYPVADQWNFVALVVEPTQATMYLDTGWGLQTAFNAVSHGTALWSNVRLGSDSYGGRDYKGGMDDVAVYAYAMAPDEIDNIRKAGFSGIYTPAKAYRWKGTNGANWSVAANWNNTVPGASDVAILSDDASAGAKVNLDTDITVGGLRFNNKVANQTLASTSGKTLTLTNGSLVMVEAGSHSISANVNSDGTVTSSGLGALTLAGATNYIGGSLFANGASLTIPGGATVTVNGERFLANNGITVALSGVLNVRDWGTIATAEGFPGAPESMMILKDSGQMNVPTSFFIVGDDGLNDGRLVIQGSAALNASMLILGQYGHGAKGYVTQQGASTVSLTLANPSSLWYVIPALQIGSSASINWGGTAGNGQGEYHLDGGTLTAHSIGGGGGAQGGSSKFYFNGGTLKPTVSDADVATALAGMAGQGTPAQTVFMQYLTQVVVQQNGAIIDTAGHSITIDQSLEHDPALGATPDGGLHAMSTGGPGTLALYKLGSFTGPLAIDTGVTVNLGYAGDQKVASVSIGGVNQGPGTFGAGHLNPGGVFTGTGTVTVLPAPPAPVLPVTSFSRPGGVPTFTGVATVSGYTYYLVWKNDLTDASWTRITPGTVSTGSAITLTDPSPSPQHRFYRIEVQ